MRQNPLRYFRQAGSQRNRKRLELLLDYCQEGTLLDVGCGEGGFLAVASSHFSVEGIDRQPGSPHLSGPGAQVRIIEADINEVELEPARYDVITMFNVLEHLPDPSRVIQEAYKGLRPGGVLFGSVPNNRWGAGKIQTLGSNFFDRTHCSTFHPDVWRESFESAGFQRTWFFGEVLVGRRAFYCTSPRVWETVSFNLMFLCRKEPREAHSVEPPLVA